MRQSEVRIQASRTRDVCPEKLSNAPPRIKYHNGHDLKRCDDIALALQVCLTLGKLQYVEDITTSSTAQMQSLKRQQS